MLQKKQVYEFGSYKNNGYFKGYATISNDLHYTMYLNNLLLNTNCRNWTIERFIDRFDSYVNYNKRISIQEKNNIIEIASEIIKQRKQG